KVSDREPGAGDRGSGLLAAGARRRLAERAVGAPSLCAGPRHDGPSDHYESESPPDRRSRFTCASPAPRLVTIPAGLLGLGNWFPQPFEKREVHVGPHDPAIAFARQKFKKKRFSLASEVDQWHDAAFLNKAKVCINGRLE